MDQGRVPTINVLSKTAIVTGGAQGIGKAIALTLAREGADVVIADIAEDGARSVAQEVESMGRKALALNTDITNAQSCQEMVARTLQEFGKVDILVNNAAVQGIDLGDFWKVSPEACERIVVSNLLGSFHVARAVLPHMIERKYGKIIFISSDAGRVGERLEVPYSGAKAGVIGFTKALAKQVGRYGICVNCVSPAIVRTPYTEAIFPEVHGGTFAEKEEYIARRSYPLRPGGEPRLGRPEDVAAAVLYFASDAAGWITGQTLSVNGGYCMP